MTTWLYILFLSVLWYKLYTFWLLNSDEKLKSYDWVLYNDTLKGEHFVAYRFDSES